MWANVLCPDTMHCVIACISLMESLEALETSRPPSLRLGELFALARGTRTGRRATVLPRCYGSLRDNTVHGLPSGYHSGDAFKGWHDWLAELLQAIIKASTTWVAQKMLLEHVHQLPRQARITVFAWQSSSHLRRITAEVVGYLLECWSFPVIVLTMADPAKELCRINDPTINSTNTNDNRNHSRQGSAQIPLSRS